jgi:broad-specificity NMP kinase
MPYIPEEERGRVAMNGPTTVGELNWIVSSSLAYYIEEHGLSYATINDVVGVLECAKQEVYRRVAAPYEDKKCKENGDVYDT